LLFTAIKVNTGVSWTKNGMSQYEPNELNTFYNTGRKTLNIPKG